MSDHDKTPNVLNLHGSSDKWTTIYLTILFNLRHYAEAFVIISQVDFISVLLCGCAAAEILFTALRSLKTLRLLGLQLIVQMSETSM